MNLDRWVRLQSLSLGDSFIHPTIKEVHTVIGYEVDINDEKTKIITRNHKYPEAGALGSSVFGESPDMLVGFIDINSLYKQVKHLFGLI